MTEVQLALIIAHVDAGAVMVSGLILASIFASTWKG